MAASGFLDSHSASGPPKRAKRQGDVGRPGPEPDVAETSRNMPEAVTGLGTQKKLFGLLGLVLQKAFSTFTKPPLFRRNRLTGSVNPSFESCEEGKAQ